MTRRIRNTGRPLRDRLIAQGICIDCQLRDAATTVRCGICQQTHNRQQRERNTSRSRTARWHMRRSNIRSYTTLKDRGLIK